MKQGFVRGLWGNYQDCKTAISKVEYYMKLSRYKIDNDIKLVTSNPYEKDLNLFVYVFGEDNYKLLEDKGFKCKLLDKKPNIFEMKEHWWIHKLEILKAASEDFDEFCFMDWDCIPFKPIPKDYWEIMSKRYPIQIPLRGYKRRMLPWRKDDQRTVCCAGFIYIRNKNIPNELMDVWKKMNANVTEEVILSKYIDDIMGEWIGIKKYWDIIEPDLFYLHLPRGQQIYSKEIFDSNRDFLKSKKQFLWHISFKDVALILDHMNKDSFDDVVNKFYKNI